MDEPLETPAEVVDLTPKALRDWFVSGRTLTLLDVREPAERKYASIKPPPEVHDLFIPMRELPARLDDLARANHAPVVVYCHHGVRSLAVANWLAQQRAPMILHNLKGGIDAWSILVDPTVPRYF